MYGPTHCIERIPGHYSQFPYYFPIVLLMRPYCPFSESRLARDQSRQVSRLCLCQQPRGDIILSQYYLSSLMQELTCVYIYIYIYIYTCMLTTFERNSLIMQLASMAFSQGQPPSHDESLSLVYGVGRYYPTKLKSRTQNL